MVRCTSLDQVWCSAAPHWTRSGGPLHLTGPGLVVRCTSLDQVWWSAAPHWTRSGGPLHLTGPGLVVRCTSLDQVWCSAAPHWTSLDQVWWSAAPHWTRFGSPLHLILFFSRLKRFSGSFGRYRCDYVDSRSMSFDVKVLFGNLSLLSAPAFSFRTKAL